MTSDTAHHDPEIGEVARPGHDLRAARERAGESVESMAERLRLSVAQLEALELDDYAELPPPAFVRGYVRAYARELGLEPERFVAAYDATGVSGNDPELRLATRSEEQAGGHSALTGVLLIAVVALGGMGAWWYQQRTAEPGSGETPEAASETATAQADDTADGSSSSGDEGDETPAGDTAADDGGSAGEEAQAGETAPEDANSGDADGSSGAEEASGDAGSAEPETSSAEAGGGGDEAETAESPDEGGDGATVTASPSVDDTAANTTAEDAATQDTAEVDAASSDASATEEPDTSSPAATDSPSRATTAAASSGPDQVVLEFDGRSWLEVSDSRDRDLVYTLYFGSEPLTLRGYAPFEIFLGNSPAVDVTFNGEPVDKTAFTRSDNTARFVVDQDGARSR